MKDFAFSPKGAPTTKIYPKPTFCSHHRCNESAHFKTKTQPLRARFIFGCVIDVGISAPAADDCASDRDAITDCDHSGSVQPFLRLHPLAMEGVPRVFDGEGTWRLEDLQN